MYKSLAYQSNTLSVTKEEGHCAHSNSAAQYKHHYPYVLKNLKVGKMSFLESG